MKNKSKRPEPKTICVYFEKSLHKSLKERAAECGRSVSGHLKFLARQDMERKAAA